MPSVADLLIEGLRRAGVPRLFAVAGGLPSPLLEAARAHGLAAVAARSEWSACVMAAVGGELGRVPGVVVARGPGALGAAAGVAHARRDRAPLILLTEREATSPPAADEDALWSLLAKQSLTVSADSALPWLAHAVQLALAEPRGPVHLAVAPGGAGAAGLPVAAEPRPAPGPAPDRAALDAAAALIERADRPVVVAGLGCRAEDAGWVRAFAEALPAPVLTTLKAKGTMPEPHPLALGVLAGGPLEAGVLARSDLVVAVGLDAAELEPEPWPPALPVLRIGRVAAGGEDFRAVAEVAGEPGLVLEELAPRLRGKARADWDVAEVDRMKRDLAARLDGGPGLTLERVARIARELSPAGTLAAIDGGPAMLPVARAWQAVAPGECLVPSRLAAAGFALPAAIAAGLARPDRRVLCFTEAAGLMRTLAELETAVRLGLPVVVAVAGDVAGELPLAAAAAGLGAAADTVADAPRAQAVLAAALAAGRAALVEVRRPE